MIVRRSPPHSWIGFTGLVANLRQATAWNEGTRVEPVRRSRPWLRALKRQWSVPDQQRAHVRDTRLAGRSRYTEYEEVLDPSRALTGG